MKPKIWMSGEARELLEFDKSFQPKSKLDEFLLLLYGKRQPKKDKGLPLPPIIR